jgi:hypothetical protein
MARAKTAAQRAASKRNLIKARAARKRGKRPGKIFDATNRWVTRGKGPKRRAARLIVAGGVAYGTPYGLVYGGSGVRKWAHGGFNYQKRAMQNARDRVG